MTINAALSDRPATFVGDIFGSVELIRHGVYLFYSILTAAVQTDNHLLGEIADHVPTLINIISHSIGTGLKFQVQTFGSLFVFFLENGDR